MNTPSMTMTSTDPGQPRATHSGGCELCGRASVQGQDLLCTTCHLRIEGALLRLEPGQELVLIPVLMN